MNFEIIPVSTRYELNQFIKSQWNFYKGDKNFVPPVIQDRKKLLSKEKNPFFRHSDMQLFLAKRGREVVGRIAAISNDNHNLTHNDKVGFFGFFECENDQETANALFKAAEKWLHQRGFDTMRGPENPSQNDEVGLLINGFDSPPVMLMTYNPRYYINLIENAGFHKAKDLYAYHLTNDLFRTEKLKKLRNLVIERQKVTLRQVNFADKEQFKKDVATIKDIYNSAWEPNWGFVKMTEEEFDFLAEDLRQVADPRFALIAESNGEVAGFALALPDINQCLIHNSKGSLLGAAWQLFTKKRKINWLRIIVLGIVPAFQQKGIDAVLYMELGDRGPKAGIYDAEASWILEDNLMMNRGLTVTMNAQIYKTYRIYEKGIK